MEYAQLSSCNRTQYNPSDSPYLFSALEWSESIQQTNTHPTPANTKHSNVTLTEPGFIIDFFHNILVQSDTYIRGLSTLPSQIFTTITQTPQTIDQ